MNKLGWLLLLAALALNLAARLPGLDLPLDRDEGEVATLAQQWARPGGLAPWRDLMHLKPPLAPALARAAFALGGESVASFRRMALAWQLATAAALFALAAWALSPWAGFWAAALYALAGTHPLLQGLAASADALTALPLALAALVLARGDGRRHWLAAGLLLGAAALAKQSAALALPLFAVAAWTPGRRLRACAWLAAGFVLAWAAAVAALAAWAPSGAARAMLDQCVGYTAAYARSGWGLKARVLAPLKALLPLLLLGVPALLGVRAEPNRVLKRLLIAWLAAALAAAVLAGRAYPHYWLPLAAPLAVAGGLALARGSRTAMAAALAAGLLWALASRPVWTAADGAARSRALYGMDNFAVAPEAAALIRSGDGGRLWVWGSEAELYFLAGRAPATRLMFHYPLTGEAPEVSGGWEAQMAALDDPGVTAAVLFEPLSTAPEARRAALAAALAKNFPRTVRHGDVVLGFRR